VVFFVLGAASLVASDDAVDVDLPVESEAPPPPAEPVVAGDRGVQVVVPDGAFCGRLEAREGDDVRVLVADGCPDRVALSHDGDRVAFVSGVTGIASVYLVPFAGGDPVQLTNVGLEDAPITVGRPPAGFVPPPHGGAPWFDGDVLRWVGPDGPHEVALP